MLMATRFQELANSENKLIQRRFWACCFVTSLIFTSLICFALKYSEYIKSSDTLELQFKALLIIALVINTTTLLINYLVSFKEM
jgi:hypothetical protein